MRESLLKTFFAFAACSWVPHWSCHYYRLETGSSFVVGSWEFSQFDSVMSLLIYSGLIFANIACVVRVEPRRVVALLSGLLHIGIGSLHAYRLAAPFRFEVFGYNWSQKASLREAVIVIPFGILCLWMARKK